MTTSNVFKSDYEAFIYTSRYARWLPDENRRENWAETVDRYTGFMFDHVAKRHSYIVDRDMRIRIWEAIHNFEVMPSMRVMMTAGEALERDNTAGYNCAYLPVDSIKSFDETMYILMCGTGVGYSVERKYTNKLPTIYTQLKFDPATYIVVQDSKEGWAKSYRELIVNLYSGIIPVIDTTLVRPAGARLKTFGGRASGPAPLLELFDFTIAKFKAAAGRKLKPIECHDIMCKIGAIVVVGGVRRSAMISLSDLDDPEMASAKAGEWWDDSAYTDDKGVYHEAIVREGQRSLANNSVAYEGTPEVGTFMAEWLSLYNSHSGERGIFNRVAAQDKADNGRRDCRYQFGTNPCSEIILRPYQFCNLSECVIRSTDGKEQIREKIKIATIIGTLQSTLTYFPYLSKEWAANTDEERLLGVSLTGIMDNQMMSVYGPNSTLPDMLEDFKNVAINTNANYADAIGIPRSTAITCVKPSGTVSQLVDSASGIHGRHSDYYIRTVRADNKDPLTEFMKSYGIPNEPDVTRPNDITVFSFPKKAPKGAVMRYDRSAIKQLELWLLYQRHWCEHKPSVTISVRNEEWPAVGAWVYEHFDEISGVSFLPYDGGTYRQAPYQECSEDEYNAFVAKMPATIDWSKLADFEKTDHTTSIGSLSCSADGEGCENVDVVT